MKALHVALIVKNTPASYAREDKNAGYFSYAVPEFRWDYFSPGKGETVNTGAFAALGFDAILHIDGGNWCDYQPGLPIIYYVIDSTLSDEQHFLPRFEQASKADLVLVDHDDLARFAATGRTVRRWAYCVNDGLFHAAPVKSLDVCFHCGGHPNREAMRVALSEMCRANNLSYASGAVALDRYAADLNRAKVVVNIPRTPRNRPHRVFDAMAAGAALITAPLPDVSGETRKSGLHYIEAAPADLPDLARRLASTNNWQLPALAGQEWVKAHTWAERAQELRQMLYEEFGL